KTTNVTRQSSEIDTLISSHRERLQLTAWSNTQRTIAGVTIRAPAASPSHQVIQISLYRSQSAYPPRVRVVTPNVALTVVLRRAARSTNANVSRWCEKTFLPFANWLTRNAPKSPSNVFPVAMLREVATEPAVVKLTTNAPRKIAGHTPKPSKRKAARLIPVGGHTGVALG